MCGVAIAIAINHLSSYHLSGARSQCDDDGACAAIAGRGGAGGGGRGGDVGPGGAAGAVLLRVRGLAGGQRQQQRHRIHGSRQLPALRRRLRRRAHRPLLQRPHHRRRHIQASGVRRLHPAVRRREQRPAPHRRQLRLRRRRDPRRDRAATGWADHLPRAGAELPERGGGAGQHPGRRGLRGGAPEPVHLHRRHGQQRLPQQLLHAGLLRHRQPVHADAVRRRPRRPLRAAPPVPLQLRGAQGGADGRGAGRVQPQRAGHAERQRRLLRRPDQRRRQDVQPAARPHRRPVQRPPRRPLHLRQHRRHLLRHPQGAGLARPQGHQHGLLRRREEQRPGHLPALPDALRQPPRVPLLGRLPPDGGRQHPRRTAGVQLPAVLRRAPRRHPHPRAPLA